MPANEVRLYDLGRGALRLIPELRHMARSLPQLLDLPFLHRNRLDQAVRRIAKRFPGRPALWSTSAVFTWAELDAWADRLCISLRTHGVKPGHVIGLHCSNRPEVLAILTATSRLGCTLALFNTSQQGRALEHSISASQVTMAITEQVTANCWNGLNTIPLDQLLLEADRNTHVGFQETALGNNAAFYIFTSGTTGLPKASIMSHVRWLKAAYGYGYGMLRLHETDVLYNALPLYHNLATTIAWGSCVATGACFAISERFSASAYWDECRASGATCVSYIGELPRYLLAQPESARDREHRVRLATGVGLRHSLWNEFKTRFGIERVAEFYGSSEGNTVFLNLFGLDKTVGFSPTPHKLVAYDRAEGQPLRNQQGQLIPVKHGDAGLLLSRVTKRFPYDGFTDTQASEKRLYRSPFGKGHTYVDSGDLLRKIGYGHAVFVDRVGDSFRWKGENVATAEVEAILDQVSYIRESTAYGITLENTDGTPGMATIACDKGMFDPLALYQHCRTHLPEYAVPVFLRIQRDLERTGTFKHQRAALRTLGLTRIHESVLYQRKGDFPWRPIGDTEN